MKRILILAALALTILGCTPREATYSVPSPQDVVMYQVNPRVFAPENSLAAVIPHLDSIKSLGTNVVWIMPIYPIGQVKSKNSPYSIADYKGVNPEFGTFKDLKNLVAECHKRGMAFIMDWVANHTAWDNVWMADHKDWYTQDENGEVIYPRGTDWTDVADLNYDCPEMRLAMIDAMEYWVRDAHVDGFRCDVADAVPADFWAQAITAIRTDAGRPILMLAEGNQPKTFEGGFDMNYAWHYLAELRNVFCSDSSAVKLIEADAKEYAEIPEGKVKLRFTTNHDEATKKSTVDEFGGIRGAMAAYVAAIFTRGAALVYGQQEVAHPDVINFFQYNEVDWTAHPEVRAEYRHLLSIFKENPQLHKGAPVSYTTPDVLMYEKPGLETSYLVIVNVRGAAVEAPVPGQWQGVELSDLGRETTCTLGETVALEPFEYIILKK